MAKRKGRNDFDYSLLMTKNEAAELTGVSVPWFDDNIKPCPSLPKVKVGTKTRYPRDPFVEWMGKNWELFK
ncbi:helix-turn-helix domain-containing protein [Lactococcus garvieae]|uniref:DNA-binding protein n=1 Tax=Lactococcus garvieae TaxID=1363 RepID=A0A1I4I673_9LACT|nr:helix-turn-helix domain-containing protein [Lactococcus garvieae]SFL49908.1 hypothetical protein SAMN05216438_11341 [Lactococcus garvieae]